MGNEKSVLTNKQTKIEKNKTGRVIGRAEGAVFGKVVSKASLKRYPPGEALNEVKEGATQISEGRAFQAEEEQVQRPWGQSICHVHRLARRLELSEQQGSMVGDVKDRGVMGVKSAGPCRLW